MKKLSNIIEGILDIGELSNSPDKGMLNELFAPLLKKNDRIVSYRNNILTIQSVELKLNENAVSVLENIGIKKLVLTGPYANCDFFIHCPKLLRFAIDNHVQDTSHNIWIVCNGIQQPIKSSFMRITIRCNGNSLQLNKTIEAPQITLRTKVGLGIHSTFNPIAERLKIIHDGSGGSNEVIKQFKNAGILDDNYFMTPRSGWNTASLQGLCPCQCLGLKHWKINELIIGTEKLADNELVFLYKKQDKDSYEIPNSDWNWKWNCRSNFIKMNLGL